jgi:hypothetical protein
LISTGSLDHGIYKNFELRTIRVVTLFGCNASVANYALRRNWLASTGRQGTGCAFRSQFANSCGSKRIAPANRKDGSLPPAAILYTCWGVTWNNFATSRARKTRLSFSNCSIRLIFVHLNRRRFCPLTRRQSRWCKTVRAFRQTASSFRAPPPAPQISLHCDLTSSRNVTGQSPCIDLCQGVFRLHTLQVDHGGLNVTMAHPVLQRPDVDAVP